jgi:hypothetical protein
MADHDDTIGGQMHVQLESIGAGGMAAIKRGDGVFRPERASTAMREHEGPVVGQERH